MGLTWISDNKGGGSWPFIPQPDKPHYNEGNLISDHDDPVWKMSFSGEPITSIHHPWCGYWTKDYVPPAPAPPDADIFVSNSAGTYSIYGVHFDGNQLSWLGTYKPDKDNNGLILYEDNLMIVCGAGGVDAELRSISTNAVGGSFPLLNTYTPFNSYDVRTAIYGWLVNGELGKIYYSDTTTVMVSLNELVRNKRGFRNTVITGTDGNLYVVDASVTWWAADWHPITGTHWSNFWNLIEDNICDTTVESWEGDLVNCSSTVMDLCFHNGYLYTVDFSSYDSPLTKIHPETLETELRYVGSYYNRVTAYGNRIYTLGGVTSATVYIHNAGNLNLISSQFLPDGRSAGNGDLEVVGNSLIVSTHDYVNPNNTLYKLSLDDLSIIDSISTVTGTGTGGQRLAAINDTYVAVAWNNGISVYNIETMQLVDRLNTADYDIDLGANAQAIVVKHR
jgi:hypothetical protein